MLGTLRAQVLQLSAVSLATLPPREQWLQGGVTNKTAGIDTMSCKTYKLNKEGDQKHFVAAAVNYI